MNFSINFVRDNEKYKFYNVNPEYVSFLHDHDSNVVCHLENNRKYLGIVFEINGTKFLAPLTSDNCSEDDKNGRSDKDYLRKSPRNMVITDIGKNKNEKVGLIKLGNMIPVFDDVIEESNFNEEEDEQYRQLLIKQFFYINNDDDILDEIKRKAEKAYNISISKTHFLYKQCRDVLCDFEILYSCYLEAKRFVEDNKEKDSKF